MSYYPDPQHPIKNLVIEKPSQKEKKHLHLLIILGFASSLAFLVWFFQFHEAGHPVLFYPFTFAVLFLVSRIFFEWFNFWGIDKPTVPEPKTQFHVDILTTFCAGEPKKMVEATLLAAKNITYPHKTIYLCDEANDTWLRIFCAEHGIKHVTRTDKSHAKAGNINNALKQATGDLCVIMDPDHIPVPEFLDRVLPYFEDPKTGYVQCCQGYYNQEESPIALGACEQTYHFYGPQMMGMGTYNTAQAIGANCTFRRSALDSIGGHSAGLTEDMHTSMNLQAKGWKTIYIPEMLSRGLVPADVVAFYKQQLKWSRGSFEMLFEKYPRLFGKFTWKQKLHHLMTPLFYLNGLTSLIFLTLPILSLCLSDVPVHIDFMIFMAYFVPVVGFQLIIRQYVQRWLYKPQERGLHLTGGILMVGTWWIYLTGFLYSLVRKKVPYLPTPKEGQKKNFFLLLLPNILLMVGSLFSVFYGLSKDWSPFSWLMSSFAILNVTILSYFCLMCQQKWLVQIKHFFSTKQYLHLLESEMKIKAFRYSQLFFFSLRKYSILIAVCVFCLSLTNAIVTRKDENLELKAIEKKELEYGGFYVGYSECDDQQCKPLPTVGDSFTTSLAEIRLDISLNQASTTEVYRKAIQTAGNVPIPLIHLHFQGQIGTSTFDILGHIIKGKADKELMKLFDVLKEADKPCFIHLIANPLVNRINTEEEHSYKKAWRHITHLLYKKGLSNTVLLFAAHSQKQLDMLYPGDDYVEWIMVELSDTSRSEDYHPSLTSLKKPVLFALNSDGTSRTNELVKRVSAHAYTTGLMLRSHKSVTEATKKQLGSYFSTIAPLKHLSDATSDSKALQPLVIAVKSPMLTGKTGDYTFLKNNQPFFVKGIAYNVTHDWRDPEIALTRKELTKDFKKIKEMGANTVRRYGTCDYDLNIFNVAHENDLQVIYGFWLEPEVDYLKDSVQLLKYENVVLSNVQKFKDHPALLSWGVGNETWGLLKYHYGEPYLSDVRKAYIAFLERLCQKIKVIDPLHPVMTVIEHNESQVIEELHSLKTGAPSLDLIGTNAYYEEQISMLDSVMQEHYPEKPYLVTEYGPRGYWHPNYTRYENENVLAEDHDQEKARLYKDQWNKHILPNKGRLLGAVAYSWTDRMEGTATWYGITDRKRRTKPAYYELRKMWTGQNIPVLPITQASIQSKEKTFFPGRKYVFEASIKGKGECSYEWSLMKFGYVKEVTTGLKPINNGSSVEIEIPKDPAEYRIYLYVTDKDGNVVTASKGLKTDYSFMDRLLP